MEDFQSFERLEEIKIRAKEQKTEAVIQNKEPSFLENWDVDNWLENENFS